MPDDPKITFRAAGKGGAKLDPSKVFLDEIPNQNGDVFPKIGEALADGAFDLMGLPGRLEAGVRPAFSASEEQERYENYKRVPDRCFFSQESWDALLADMEALMPDDPVIIESTPRTPEEESAWTRLTADLFLPDEPFDLQVEDDNGNVFLLEGCEVVGTPTFNPDSEVVVEESSFTFEKRELLHNWAKSFPAAAELQEKMKLDRHTFNAQHQQEPPVLPPCYGKVPLFNRRSTTCQRCEVFTSCREAVAHAKDEHDGRP
jgi:hypothetical protein